MKLSELVTAKNKLEKLYDYQPIVDEIDLLCSNLITVEQHLDDELQQSVEAVVNEYQQLIPRVQSPNELVKQAIEKINHAIFERSKKFFADNYDLEFVYNSPDGVRQARRLYMPKEVSKEVIKRIESKVDWRYPTLEIGCRDGEWTKHLISSDPLYLVDPHREFLESAVSKYPEEYQRRVRKYQIRDWDFKELPQNQFGFAFSWNHFNYMSLDTVKQYLKSMYQVLRPGGVFMFSYNNADLPAAAGHAESYFMSYIPKSMLLPMVESLGFEISATFDFEPAVSWIEVRKPGELETVKAHQVLGRVKNINL